MTTTANSVIAVRNALKADSIRFMEQTTSSHVSPIAEGKLWIGGGNIGVEADRIPLAEIHKATFDGDTLTFVTKGFVAQVGIENVII